jgi:hypothetical protein
MMDHDPDELPYWTLDKALGGDDFFREQRTLRFRAHPSTIPYHQNARIEHVLHPLCWMVYLDGMPSLSERRVQQGADLDALARVQIYVRRLSGAD